MQATTRTRLTMPILALTVAALAGMGMAGCSPATGSPTAGRLGGSAPIVSSTTSVPATVRVPEGWKTYTYGTAAISVPATWQVKRDTNCPNTTAPGALLLGYPKTLQFCPAYQLDTSYVALFSPPGAGSESVGREKPELINGVQVYVGFGSPTALQWTAPSLGIEITATGPLAAIIVATLRRA
jgi:hypothetical protein